MIQQNIQIQIDDWGFAACNLENGKLAMFAHGEMRVMDFQSFAGSNKFILAKAVIDELEKYHLELGNKELALVGVNDKHDDDQ